MDPDRKLFAVSLINVLFKSMEALVLRYFSYCGIIVIGVVLGKYLCEYNSYCFSIEVDDDGRRDGRGVVSFVTEDNNNNVGGFT